jgi:hypothetical protein
MSQEFDSITDEAKNDDLLPGWRYQWDNSCKRGYYFNTLDYDIQTDIAKVHGRAALTALKKKENKPEEYVDLVCPDGVLSNKNNTISPSPVTDKNMKRYYK